MKTRKVLDEYALDEFRVPNYQHWFTKLESPAVFVSIQLPEIIVTGLLLFKIIVVTFCCACIYSYVLLVFVLGIFVFCFYKVRILHFGV